jgi:DNA polymerase
MARTLVKARRFDDLEMLFGNVPETLSQLIRTAFVAAPGHRFLIVDFSAIEARVIAWLANCAWRLEVFATHGKIYEASAEQMFRLPPGSVTRKSPYRQKGKIAELALGYQGGVAALKTMGALEMGLTEAELEPIKTAWRAANPEIVKFWGATQSAALAAVTNRACERLQPEVRHGLRLRFCDVHNHNAGRRGVSLSRESRGALHRPSRRQVTKGLRDQPPRPPLHDH